jgi:hypothetical protein
MDLVCVVVVGRNNTETEVFLYGSSRSVQMQERVDQGKVCGVRARRIVPSSSKGGKLENLHLSATNLSTNIL